MSSLKPKNESIYLRKWSELYNEQAFKAARVCGVIWDQIGKIGIVKDPDGFAGQVITPEEFKERYFIELL